MGDTKISDKELYELVARATREGTGLQNILGEGRREPPTVTVGESALDATARQLAAMSDEERRKLQGLLDATYRVLQEEYERRMREMPVLIKKPTDPSR